MYIQMILQVRATLNSIIEFYSIVVYIHSIILYYNLMHAPLTQIPSPQLGTSHGLLRGTVSVSV